jgi:uncharacterized protein (TIGR00730 family)
MTDRPADNSLRDFDYEHNPTWRIFRIMSEFVDGFTFLARIQRSVTIFGSARLSDGHPYYQMARELGKRLAERGFTIVTGGGPGIMQASNQGAYEAGGNSVGLNIELPHEQRINPYVKQCMSFNYFFSRKVMLDFSAEAYIFFPGGYGTLDEFFELVTLVQTGKVSPDAPILLIGRDYWDPLVQWIDDVLLHRLHAVSPQDLRLWTLTDNLDDAVVAVEQGVQRQTEQRLASKGRAGKTADDTLEQATKPGTETQQ